MSEHSKFQLMMTDFYYREVNEAENTAFSDHLKSCSVCQAEYDKIAAALELMNNYKPENSETDSEKFWAGIESKLNAADAEQKTPVYRLSPWMIQTAAAVILVVCGFFGGYYFFSSQQTENVTAESEKQTADHPPVELVSLDEQTQKYFDKSKIMMMSLVNFDLTKDDPYALNLSYQKKISGELIAEAADLKDKLEHSNRPQLKKLVTDLEIILTQIANLESEKDLPGIELIRSSVDRKGVLLKIDIEAMKGGVIKSRKQESPRKQKIM